MSVLALLLVALIATPFLEGSTLGIAVEGALLTLVLLAGVLAIGGRRAKFIVALSLAVPTVLAKWLTIVWPGWVVPEFFLLLAIATFGFVAWQFLRHSMTARRVDANVLCSGIAAFLLVALLFAFVYQLVDRNVPGSFVCSVGSQPNREMKGMFAVYFSLVTLCTVGFGDIIPATDVARMCAMIEGATGVFFVAVLISRLVSLYTMDRQAEFEREGRDSQ